MKILLYIKIIVAMITFSSCKQKPMVDLLIHNATIYTVDQDFSIVSAMAINDGKIVEVGKSNILLNKYQAQEVIDLKGKFVYPGFIDPHSHFIGYGRELTNANLVGCTSVEDMLKRVTVHHSKYERNWVLGRGWDQNLWPIKEFPNKHLLDKAFPANPVLLIRVDGHAAVANSVALKMANITAKTKVFGGSVEVKNGQPTGIIIDNAIDLVRRIIPPLTTQDNIDALLNAQEKVFEVGLTSVSEAGLDASTIYLMDSMQGSGKLNVRIYAMLNPTEANFEAFMYSRKLKTDYLNVRSVKLFADGALGSRGAKLLKPYSDNTTNYGILLETPEFLEKVSRKAHKFGYQVNVHCIGDSANRLILNIFGNILKEPNDLRWRIEHAQVVHPDDFDLFGKYGIIPSIQAIHATSDMEWAPLRLGAERMKSSYAYQQLLAQNGWLPNGSDFPVESINPLLGFHAAVARQDANGNPPGGFQMENALTRKQALLAMTIWAAKAQFEENEKGSLETGKFADFVVLEKDIMAIPLPEIPSLKVKYTFLGGEKVFGRE